MHDGMYSGSLAAGSAFAEIDVPDVDVETGFVIVSGALAAQQETGVTLMVFMPDTNVSGILQTPDILEENLYYTDTVQSFSDGVFEFEFDMTKGPGGVEGETGVYPFILACGDMKQERLTTPTVTMCWMCCARLRQCNRRRHCRKCLRKTSR